VARSRGNGDPVRRRAPRGVQITIGVIEAAAVGPL